MWYNPVNMKDWKIIVSAVFVFILAVFLMFFFAAKNNSKRAIELYKQGLSFYNQKDYQNAYYNFSKIAFFSELYQISLLKQGQCALNIGDKKTAYQKFKYLSNVSKDTYIAPFALYHAALINMEHKKYSYAYKKLKKIYKNYPDSDYKKASSYLLGVLYKNKKPHLAKKYFTEYLEYAPQGRWAKDALSECEELNLVMDSDEKLIMAKSLYSNSDYTKALSYAKDLSFPEAVLLNAKIYEALGEYKNAYTCYLRVLTLCDETIEPDEISQVVDKVISFFDGPKSDVCLSLLKQTKNSASYPAVLFEYTKYVPKITAVKCWETIYTKYPNSYWAAQSLWNTFLYNYKLGYIKKSKELSEVYLERYSNKKSTPAMKFWHAKILLEQRKTQQAKLEFKELIKTEPDSYYAYVAHNILRGVNTPFNTSIKSDIKTKVKFSKSDLKQIFNNDKTLVLLATLGDTQAIGDLRVHNDFADSYIAFVQKNIPYSIYYAQKGFDKLEEKPLHSDGRYKLLYPIKYAHKINKSASQNAQNPYLMLALMREESRFNPKALSPVGAAGLMQLMPQTASALGYGTVSATDLYNEDLNIKLGIKYFSDLKNMFEQNEMLAVLSYNGGPNNVRVWMDNLDKMSFDEFVEDIPYSETQNYIKRVFGSYWNYIRIYN